MYWYPKSKINSENVILYFDRNDSPCNDLSVKEVESFGFSWINITKKSDFKVDGIHLFNTIMGIKFPHYFSLESLYMYVLQMYIVYLVECLRKIIKNLNVKVVHQHQECWPEPLSLALATRLEGGIFVWNHWSVDHYPISYFNVGFADLVLFRDYNDGYINCHDFYYKYLIQTGLIAADNFHKSDKAIGQSIRKKFSKRVNFVITVFDTSHNPDKINATTSNIIKL